MTFALILGASSGFGAATASSLARSGFDIAGVHLDRRSTLPLAEKVAAEVREAGRKALFFNKNAADPATRTEVLDAIAAEGGKVQLLFHSLAFGTLKPLVGEDAVTQAQLEMTLNVMASSLVYWTQELVSRDLLMEGGRILAMTSSGGTRAIPSYGPVGAAKAALEAYCRQLAYELAPRNVAVNAIRAGVTDTPALQKIPGSALMLETQRARHPAHRLTTPEDVAEAVALLVQPGARWISGNTLGIDGGEEIVA